MTRSSGGGRQPTDRTSDARERLLGRVIEQSARDGVGDTSLRALADRIGTSHRMLIYHFGSRAGLLQAVVDRVETSGRETLRELMSDTAAARNSVDAAWRFWTAITDEALTFGPLFFELSSHAMQGLPHADTLRRRLVAPWVDVLADTWAALGVPRADARRYARLDLAVARGLLYDLLLTGQRRQVDAAMREYADTVMRLRAPRS